MRKFYIDVLNQILCRISGTWQDSSTANITVGEFCQHRKNAASDC